jgi:hypothetical protein
MSKVKLKNVIKNRQLLLDALKLLEKDGAKVEVDGEKIYLRHKSIETFRSKNLHFTWNERKQEFEATGDAYKCGDAYRAMVQKVEWAYQTAGAMKVSTEMGYSVSQMDIKPVEMVAQMVARRY